MKKKTLGFIAGLFLIVGVVQSAYADVATDWYFDFQPDDPEAGMVEIAYYFDVATPNVVELTMDENGDDFTFINNGSFAVAQTDGKFLPFMYMGLLTGVYTYNGDGQLSDGNVTFNSGILDLYFGGQPIAELALTSGVGAIDQSGAPVNNETFTIHYESNWLDPGYFYYSDGTDVATRGLSGFTTTNAVVLDREGDILTLGSNGQFFLSPVPVPSALLLLGSGIFGLVGFIRRNI
ncbi:MAG: hypothetical protein CSA25_00470 [Desulfobacter postgatei]|uniref:PEP-CTERM protein-sorting domain-containing protein n=1 Tax=Desulfobacter postgatei TaxID=2293 RepID=A0A2G6MTU8_9BACT|nr:MAG: hypothetical protein CSA25_00470 [Desulfobacter postgatei]